MFTNNSGQGSRREESEGTKLLHLQADIDEMRLRSNPTAERRSLGGASGRGKGGALPAAIPKLNPSTSLPHQTCRSVKPESETRILNLLNWKALNTETWFNRKVGIQV